MGNVDRERYEQIDREIKTNIYRDINKQIQRYMNKKIDFTYTVVTRNIEQFIYTYINDTYIKQFWFE